MWSNDSSNSVKHKENGAGKNEKVQKERIIEGRKEKIIPSSHAMSQQGEAESRYGETSGTLWQTTNHDLEAIVVVREVDVVYPLHGDSTVGSKSTSGYGARETPISRPSERHPEFDGGGISLVVQIWGIVVSLA